MELAPEFIKEWVVPYYFEIGRGKGQWIDSISKNKSLITKDITLSLLGDFNWRTRLVGSYFAAVKNYDDLIDIIGTHLLKSEVCCVGHIYALNLTFFNSNKSIEYLNKYLDYYLKLPQLYFDQQAVLEAILYLDKINGTNHFDRHKENWESFKKLRSHPDLPDASTAFFDEQIPILSRLSAI